MLKDVGFPLRMIFTGRRYYLILLAFSYFFFFLGVDKNFYLVLLLCFGETLLCLFLQFPLDFSHFQSLNFFFACLRFVSSLPLSPLFLFVSRNFVSSLPSLNDLCNFDCEVKMFESPTTVAFRQWGYSYGSTVMQKPPLVMQSRHLNRTWKRRAVMRVFSRLFTMAWSDLLVVTTFRWKFCWNQEPSLWIILITTSGMKFECSCKRTGRIVLLVLDGVCCLNLEEVVKPFVQFWWRSRVRWSYFLIYGKKCKNSFADGEKLPWFVTILG